MELVTLLDLVAVGAFSFRFWIRVSLCEVNVGLNCLLGTLRRIKETPSGDVRESEAVVRRKEKKKKPYSNVQLEREGEREREQRS